MGNKEDFILLGACIYALSIKAVLMDKKTQKHKNL